MNDELQQRLTMYLDAIEASASKAGDFVVEQTPLLAQEYLAWEFWSSVMLCAASALVLVVLCAVFLRVWWAVKAEKDFDFNDHPEMMFLVIPLLFVALGVGCVAHNGANAVKVKVAPRVVLMEKIAELSK